MSEQLPGLPGFTVERLPDEALKVHSADYLTTVRIRSDENGWFVDGFFVATSPAQALTMVVAALRCREADGASWLQSDADYQAARKLTAELALKRAWEESTHIIMHIPEMADRLLADLDELSVRSTLRPEADGGTQP